VAADLTVVVVVPVAAQLIPHRQGAEMAARVAAAHRQAWLVDLEQQVKVMIAAYVIATDLVQVEVVQAVQVVQLLPVVKAAQVYKQVLPALLHIMQVADQVGLAQAAWAEVVHIIVQEPSILVEVEEEVLVALVAQVSSCFVMQALIQQQLPLQVVHQSLFPVHIGYIDGLVQDR
jgi:hypothetical protein